MANLTMQPVWKSVQDHFSSLWKGKESFCFQFHDAREAMGAAKSRRVFTTSHPSDFLVTHRGDMFYAEVKSCQDKVSFPFSNIETSQWNAAIRQEAAGGKYFFFIFSTVLNCWFKIPSPILISIRKSGRKSVKWAELTDYLWTPPQ